MYAGTLLIEHVVRPSECSFLLRSSALSHDGKALQRTFHGSRSLLNAVLKALKGRFIPSYNDDDFVREL